MTTILVGNLPVDAQADSIQKVFSRYGEVAEILFLKNDDSRKPRSYCVVEMPHKEEASKAVRCLNRQVYRGAFLNVRSAPLSKAELVKRYSN